VLRVVASMNLESEMHVLKLRSVHYDNIAML
jgi:hypothetical protein